MLVEMGDENYFNTDVEDNIVRRFKGLEDLSPLPFPPDDLTQKHAWRYLRIKIEKGHIRKGGKWNQIRWGDPRFLATLLLQHNILWETLKGKNTKIVKPTQEQQYKGEGDLTSIQ